jgi:hypothetical protein
MVNESKKRQDSLAKLLMELQRSRGVSIVMDPTKRIEVINRAFDESSVMLGLVDLFLRVTVVHHWCL